MGSAGTSLGVPIRMLVVDDSKVMRMVVIKALGDSGLGAFEVVEAATAEEAIEKLATDGGGVDLALVDWNLPGMSGIELARRLKAGPGPKLVPVVMLTSETAAGRIQQAFHDVQVDGYVCKPFSAQQLAFKLAPLVRQIQEEKSRKSSVWGRAAQPRETSSQKPSQASSRKVVETSGESLA
jgi:two-component system chemotaxis response regulator CheY